MVADFGIALSRQRGRRARDQTGLASPGTPQYMLPEQATGGIRQPDFAPDQYRRSPWPTSC